MKSDECATNTHASPATIEPRNSRTTMRNFLLLFLASFIALYFELIIIRYLSTEVRVFAYLKNLALIASFFGIGLGMIVGRPPRVLHRFFPWIAAVLFLLISYASFLHLTFLPIPTFDYQMFMDQVTEPGGHWYVIFLRHLGTILIYLIAVPGIMYLDVAFFAVLGGLVGENLTKLPPLQGYGVNLAGSLAGIVTFTLLAFLDAPPVVWVLLGFLALAPFFLRQPLALTVFALTVLAMAFPHANTYWSPYYRITLTATPPPPGWPQPAAYFLDVNHLFHQRIVNLSPEFTTRYPDADQSKYTLPKFELPYRLVPHPGRVLVVGAGTGNDVAAALRHGATHVDAVEIDPVITSLGRKYHPEHPYDSPAVSVFVDDARAFFQKTHQKYDLIVFGYLDSHTMVTSYSSIRLDNYVYTLESFQEARSLLNPNGTLVLSFAGGKTFLTERLYATLAQAFQAPPLAYSAGYDGVIVDGVVLVAGKAAESNVIENFPEISKDLRSHQADALLANDHWPFLYLKSRTIPVAIWSVLGLFLYFATVTLQRQVPLRNLASRQGLHLFFLGAGFMLLETKGITELSLLFGSTWVVNAVVIAAFLTMGLLANTFIMFRPVSRKVAYAFLIAVLAASIFVPYTLLEALTLPAKVAAAAVLAGIPVFFSGMIFSRSFKDVPQPAQALGINLLGAVVGGVLENLVMVGGTLILGILSLLLYGLSAAFLPASPENEAGVPGQRDASEFARSE